MTDLDRLASDLRATATTLGCEIVVLAPAGSDAEPVVISP
jgi:hypothetical protein